MKISCNYLLYSSASTNVEYFVPSRHCPAEGVMSHKWLWSLTAIDVPGETNKPTVRILPVAEDHFAHVSVSFALCVTVITTWL